LIMSLFKPWTYENQAPKILTTESVDGTLRASLVDDQLLKMTDGKSGELLLSTVLPPEVKGVNSIEFSAVVYELLLECDNCTFSYDLGSKVLCKEGDDDLELDHDPPMAPGWPGDYWLAQVSDDYNDDERSLHDLIEECERLTHSPKRDAMCERIRELEEEISKTKSEAKLSAKKRENKINELEIALSKTQSDLFTKFDKPKAIIRAKIYRIQNSNPKKV